MKVENFNDFMNTIHALVASTEKNTDLAISAAATIGSLYERGHGELAAQVLETYKPGAETMITEPEEKTRYYRFDSMADSGELYLYVSGMSTWSEGQWEQEAENTLADTIQRPQHWVIIDYEEQD